MRKNRWEKTIEQWKENKNGAWDSFQEATGGRRMNLMMTHFDDDAQFGTFKNKEATEQEYSYRSGA